MRSEAGSAKGLTWRVDGVVVLAAVFALAAPGIESVGRGLTAPLVEKPDALVGVARNDACMIATDAAGSRSAISVAVTIAAPAEGGDRRPDSGARVSNVGATPPVVDVADTAHRLGERHTFARRHPRIGLLQSGRERGRCGRRGPGFRSDRRRPDRAFGRWVRGLSGRWGVFAGRKIDRRPAWLPFIRVALAWLVLRFGVPPAGTPDVEPSCPMLPA